jgi:chromosome partitioning protein
MVGAAMHRSGQLAQLAAAYDITIIDCPPRHGDIQRSALMVADLAILPCGPSAADAWALTAAVEVLDEARALRPDLGAVVLITRKQGRTALGKSARKVLETSGLPVLSTELAHRIAYQEAIAAGRGVTAFAPNDRAAQEVKSLFDELQGIFNGKEDSWSVAPQTAAAG